jgi:hypothetical protein
VMLQFYDIAHFAAPLAVLAWLYVRRPQLYRTARTILFTTTGLALVGFWAVPLAPPRLTPGVGLAGSPGTEPLGAVRALTNQYAAMPSLHVAWSLWCALIVLAATRRAWVRVPAALLPAVTVLVVLATANHWVLDGPAGALTLCAGWGIQYVLTGDRLFPERMPSRHRLTTTAATAAHETAETVGSATQ